MAGFRHIARGALSGLILAASALLGGCIAGGDLQRVQTQSDQPRAGNVYLLRGWLGVWSYGIDDLGAKIAQAGVRATVFQEAQWAEVSDAIARAYERSPDHEPIVLVGHSWGADDAILIAQRLRNQGIPLRLDLVVTLDPVTPAPVPPNVRRCYNLFQTNLLDAIPVFRGVAVESELTDKSNIVNVDIRAERPDLLESGTNHFNIEKNPAVHAEVIRQILAVCPPRTEWAARRRNNGSGAASSAAGAP